MARVPPFSSLTLAVTPEERERSIEEAAELLSARRNLDGNRTTGTAEQVVDFVCTSAIRAAVAEEREAWALIAMDGPTPGVAAEIRRS